MGRKISDGKAIDSVAPGSTAIVFGELYRIANFTGFAMVDVDAADTDRDFALERCESIWAVAVPAGTCGTRGNYVKWTDTGGATFQKGDTHLVDDGAVKTVNSIAQVETVRNSRGYARLKLLI